MTDEPEPHGGYSDIWTGFGRRFQPSQWKMRSFLFARLEKKDSLDIVARILEAIGFQRLSHASLGQRSVGSADSADFSDAVQKHLCRPTQQEPRVLAIS
jgi:hypothetical protein